MSLEGDRDLFTRLRADNGPDTAPENTPECFLAFCGVLGLGADGPDALPQLRRWANDPRWRVREAVAMAVQRIADTRPAEAVRAMRDWARGTRLEQRAAVAALCEPRLLRDEATARAALEVLDEVTASLATGSGDGAASPSTGSGARAAPPEAGSGDRAASPETGSGDVRSADRDGDPSS